MYDEIEVLKIWINMDSKTFNDALMIIKMNFL